MFAEFQKIFEFLKYQEFFGVFMSFEEVWEFISGILKKNLKKIRSFYEFSRVSQISQDFLVLEIFQEFMSDN
jgi:hypothetical protein